MSTEAKGPLLLCYDGSSEAADAIEQAGAFIDGGRALVLYVWFPPSALMFQGRLVGEPHPLAAATAEFDAAASEQANEVAAEGAKIATQVGFDAEPVTEPAVHAVWRAIAKVADEQDARGIVVGSHGRSGVHSALLGSVSNAVVSNCRQPVLVARCDER